MQRFKILVLCLSILLGLYAVVGGVIATVSPKDDAYRDLSLFTKVLERIRQDYVETPDMEKVLKGALHGMVEALDSYSSFVEAPVYEELKDVAAQEVGTGLFLSKRYGYAYVISVMRGSPADHAGLRSGDLIESINGKQTALTSSWEAQRLVGGQEGDEVKLRLIRSRHTEPIEITLTCRILDAGDANARVLEDDFGFITIPHFQNGAAEQAKVKLKVLLSTGLKGLVVDIRGVAGGELSEAVALSDLFLAKGKKILTVENQGGKATEHVSFSDPVVGGIPIVVLVDTGTSGPAEVFAAALQDNKVAGVVGLRTNGHGSVQGEFPLEGGAVLVVSTGMMVRPSGEALQGDEVRHSGLTPDVTAPSRDFVSNFYFENMPDDAEEELGAEFYEKLDAAIDIEQLTAATGELKKRLLEDEDQKEDSRREALVKNR